MVSFLPRVPKVADPKTQRESGVRFNVGGGCRTGRKKSGTNTAPLLSGPDPMSAFDERDDVRAGDCKLQPSSTVFRKANQCKRQCELRTRISYGFWAAGGGWEITAQSRADPTSFRHRARFVVEPVEPELGEPRRRHLSPGKSHSATCHRQRLVKTEDNSASAGVSVCVCVCARGADWTG